MEFEVQDEVFVRLRPYKKCPSRLDPKYYSPYKGLQRSGSTDYKLELPPYSNVHLVFHVLKNIISDETSLIYSTKE